MNKIKFLLLYIAIAVIAATSLFNSPVKADGYLESVRLTVLSGANPALTDYFNLQSTGFSLKATLSPDYTPEELNLYLDSCARPLQSQKVIEEVYSYTFISPGDTNLELQTLLSSCEIPASSIHQLTLTGKTGELENIIWQESIASDFVAPSGAFSARNMQEKDALKVGDQVEIIYTPNEIDTLNISGQINSLPLAFTRSGNDFVALYTLREGDADRSGGILPITALRVTDEMMNVSSFEGLLPIDFTIDANSPVLTLVSPQEEIYAQSEIKVDFVAEGYDSIEMFLDGVAVASPYLTNLEEGNHILKVIARDLAGNETAISRNFSVDLTAPSGGLLNPKTEINEGENLVLSGNTERGSSVTAEIGDVVKTIVSDENGDFNINFENLLKGEYQIYLTFTDSVGNSRRLHALTLKVLAKEPQISATSDVSEAEPAKEFVIAWAPDMTEENEVVQDVAAGLNLPPLIEEEINIGQLGSGTSDSRQTFYSSWWIILSVILLAAILSIVSYSYYSKLAFGHSVGRQEEIYTPEIAENEVLRQIISREPDVEDIIEEKSLEEEENHLRW